MKGFETLPLESNRGLFFCLSILRTKQEFYSLKSFKI